MQFTTETRVGVFIVMAFGVFAYMTFQIGVFRFDRAKYNNYIVYFKDVAGLSKKADVRIAGVKVGWVDKFTLHNRAEVEAKLMVLKDYTIHSDSYAVVRQDGLLGNKYVELVSGDPLLPILSSGSELCQSNREAVSVDDILYNVKLISDNVEDVTNSLKNVLGGKDGALRIEQTMDHINQAAEKLATFADSISSFMVDNEKNLSCVVNDVQVVTNELRESIPVLSDHLHTIFDQVSRDVLPELHQSAQKISNAIDRDFGRIANKVESAASSLDNTSCQVRQGFENITEIAQKINDGEGLFGKLINDDDIYRDIKMSVKSVKKYFNKIDNVVIVVDSYSERFNRDAPGLDFKNSKGYFYFRVYPNEEHYWLLGVTTNNEGIIDRDVYLRQWFDNNGCEIIPENILPPESRDRLRFAPEVKLERRKLDAVTYNAQFAKLFTHLAFRVGLFESTAGFAIDYDIPIPYVPDHLRWVSTLEVFDLNGRQRVDDERLHLKWLNRVFVMRNFYMTFGAEDFVSKYNKNAFFGVGLRFADEDLKYLLSRILVTV